MSDSHRQRVFFLLALLLAAACAWWWFDTFEKRWAAVPNLWGQAKENSMLAATRLLTRHGFTVHTETTLGETLLKPVSGGTLIVAENGGMVTGEQGRQLLAWVRQGNTLIARPKWQDDAPEKKAPTEKKKFQFKPAAEFVQLDPVGAYFGVVLASKPGKDCTCKKSDAPAEAEKPPAQEKDAPAEAEKPPAQEKDAPAAPSLAGITLPGAAYALQLDAEYSRLQSTKPDPEPLFGDDDKEAVRVYAEGQGHVVLLAKNYFDNDSLGRFDHAELLLGLVGLNGKPGRAASNIVIVQSLDMQKWYQALWLNFQAGLLSLGVGLLMLLWVAVRRFGPVLPEPDHERRSMIEHIDASGRWLWKVPGGRDILLNAARASTDKVLQRRAPELQRMHPNEKIAHLAKNCNLAADDLVSALQGAAAKLPIEFTRQIQTLRQLRKSYER